MRNTLTLTRLVLLLALLWALLCASCGDGTPPTALPDGGMPPLPSCSGNNDGVISPGELDFTPGRVAPYAVQAEGDPPVTPRGDPAGGDGLWDFSAVVFDRLLEVPMRDPAGQWYADIAREANLALPLLPQEGSVGPGYLLLVSRDREVSILGYASVEPDEALIIYDQPAPFMLFPMELGDGWSATVRPTSGSAIEGIPLDQVVDEYRIEVDGRGSLRLPGVEIHKVLRLSLTLERRLRDLEPLVLRETYLVHECLGTVARRRVPDGGWWVVWYPM